MSRSNKCLHRRKLLEEGIGHELLELLLDLFSAMLYVQRRNNRKHKRCHGQKKSCLPNQIYVALQCYNITLILEETNPLNSRCTVYQ